MKQELSRKLNQYLANIGVSYMKLHNLHWNVVGMQFKSVHEYLETLYDGMSDVLDEVAELLKKHEEYPTASMKAMLELATIEEKDSRNYEVPCVLKIVLADMELMKIMAEDIRKEANEEDLYDVVSEMEDHLDHYNKTIWFLKSMLMGQ